MKRTLHREDSFVFPFISYEPETKLEKYPLVIQLHGAGERGNGQNELERVEVYGFSALAKSGEWPCIFVLPQCSCDTFWPARVESILKFIAQLRETFDIDERRIYLTGLSMGGYGTWFTAMASPDTFAAIAPVCGGGMAWNAHTLTMPVWAFHGDIDTVVSVNQSDEMVESMKRAGLNVRYTRLKNVEHQAWEYAYNEELLSWLLSQKKE